MSWMTGILTQPGEQPELLLPVWVYGVIALAIFAALAFVAWTYRDVANRHNHKPEPHATEHSGAPGSSSHGSGHPLEHG